MNISYKIGGLALLLLLTSVLSWHFIDRSTLLNEEGLDLEPENKKILIATSFYPLQFALERITGEYAVVKNIGGNVDPHDFSPTAAHIRTLQTADLVVLQGSDFEPWGDTLTTQLNAADVLVVLATEPLTLNETNYQDDSIDHKDIEDEQVDDEDHHHSTFDPHTWLDPILFTETVAHLTAAVSALDPDHATQFAANAATLTAELAEIDTAYRTRLSTCTYDAVIVSHEAFGYVADRYGFTTHAISGLSTQDTPSTQTLARLKTEANESTIGAILLETNNLTDYGETVARETGLTTYAITSITHGLHEGENYHSLMEQNLNTFAKALACDV